MITVTLGTISFPFDRAIVWIANLLEQEIIKEPIFVQYGTSNISRIKDHPLVTTAPNLPFPDFVKLVDDSRLVISHAGQGSTRDLVRRGANFVLLPRLAQHQEHIDDHQLMFAQSVEARGVRYCSTLKELEAIIQAPPVTVDPSTFEGARLSDHLLKRYPPSSQMPTSSSA
jgi:UDP-N-acetylglucosamine transferase subunit ALG13